LTLVLLAGLVVVIVLGAVVCRSRIERRRRRQRADAEAPYKEYEEAFWERPWDDKRRRLSKSE
jgi:flagellar biosynthesis/type III secretory pathway M-ring protein FliF/YscJ